MSDYHLHLHPHEPAPPGSPPPGEYPAGHIEAYLEAAARRGVTELGFTEHLYRCVEAADALGDFWEREPDPRLAAQAEQFVKGERNLSLDTYVGAVQAAKERGLPVALGLEVDFFPETIEAVLELVAPYPWDFLLGAVHWVGGWSIDHSEVADEFERRGVRRAYEEYFALEVALAGSGAVDVLAHCDVVKKFGHRPPDEPLDLYRELVRAASGSGVAVEVSSAGLRKPVAEIYPAPRLLAMLAEAGVPITLASDAHAPEDAGWGHQQVVEAARSPGYTASLHYRARRAEQRSLAERPGG
ncbi:MAG: histidinol-phosphatase HisJ family protein [Acidimicrobiia bacterium]